MYLISKRRKCIEEMKESLKVQLSINIIIGPAHVFPEDQDSKVMINGYYPNEISREKIDHSHNPYTDSRNNAKPSLA
jgi:hypothetical protein